MAQVYAVLHDNDDNFIIGTKFQTGYFFHGAMVQNGQPLNGTQGGGLPFNQGPTIPAFPGGGLVFTGTNADSVHGAAIEFMEETNVNLWCYSTSNNVNNPIQYRQVDFVGIHSQGFPANAAVPQYYGVYFEVTQNDLTNLLQTVQTNLTAGQGLRTHIINNAQQDINNLRQHNPNLGFNAARKSVYAQYRAMGQFQAAPTDNELSTVQVLNRNHPAGRRTPQSQINPIVVQWQNDNVVDWFYELVAGMP